MDNTTQPFGLSRWKRNAIPSKVIYVYIFVREDGTRTYSALRLLIKSSAAVWRPPPRKRKSTTKTNDSAKLLLRTNLTLILFDPLEDVSNGQDVVPFDIAESILRCFAHRREKMFIFFLLWRPNFNAADLSILDTLNSQKQEQKEDH